MKAISFQITSCLVSLCCCAIMLVGGLALAQSSGDRSITWGATITVNEAPNGATFGRMVKLADSTWLAVTTVFPPRLTSQLEFVSSTDNCRAWKSVSKLVEQNRKLDNGQLVQLRDGSILVAMRSLVEGASYRLVVYRSSNGGRSWRYLSTIDANENPRGRSNRGLWEPHLNLLSDGRLAAMYANERHADDKPSYNQVISQRVSNDHGATWNAETRVVEEPGGGLLRPGMPVWTRMANGKWIVVFELVNRNADVNYKVSEDGMTWPAGLGARIAEQHCGPYVIALTDGRLLVTSCQNEVSVSDDYGATWRRIDPSPWTFGYSFSWASIYQISSNEIAVMAAVPRQDKKSGVVLRFGTLLPSARRL